MLGAYNPFLFLKHIRPDKLVTYDQSEELYFVCDCPVGATSCAYTSYKDRRVRNRYVRPAVAK